MSNFVIRVLLAGVFAIFMLLAYRLIPAEFLITMVIVQLVVINMAAVYAASEYFLNWFNSRND